MNVTEKLAEPVTDQAVKNGFAHVERLRLRQSRIWGTRKNDQSWKTEPVLIFRKPLPSQPRGQCLRAC